jgi:PPK2 family polyphosphate:nucleotide phosphotransferase
MSGVNPQGCEVHSFKHPSPDELQHDFLWRTVVRLPSRGRIGIFNRSYYEEVLVVRVHPEILEAEQVPEARRASDRIWKHRYRSIVDLERHLHRNGTRIRKFFLHLSREEQRQRLLRRVDDQDRAWKLSPDDLTERRFWDDYMRAYQACLSATTRKRAPWYIVPADDKENARLIVSSIVLELLEELDLRYPPISPERARELDKLRERLTSGE